MAKGGTNLGPVELSSDVLPSQSGIFLTFQNCGMSDLPHFGVYISHSVALILIHVNFLYDRTYQLFQDKLSCTTEHFIRSENNLALLCLYGLLN